MENINEFNRFLSVRLSITCICFTKTRLQYYDEENNLLISHSTEMLVGTLIDTFLNINTKLRRPNYIGWARLYLYNYIRRKSSLTVFFYLFNNILKNNTYGYTTYSSNTLTKVILSKKYATLFYLAILKPKKRTRNLASTSRK